jgi:hypothetical protein
MSKASYYWSFGLWRFHQFEINCFILIGQDVKMIFKQILYFLISEETLNSPSGLSVTRS